MTADYIKICLLSDTTFSRGDGTAGEVDVEVTHDEFGLPYVPAKTLRGLLRDAWLSMAEYFPEDCKTAEEILGLSGSLSDYEASKLYVADAQLPDDTCNWVSFACSREKNPLSPSAVLKALTNVRRQTALDRTRGGAPRDGSLRSIRVILRDLSFISPIQATRFSGNHWRVLSRMCLAVRHVGAGRNRGRGHVRLSVHQAGKDVTSTHAALGI